MALDAGRGADDDDGAAVAGLDHRGDRCAQGAPGAGQVHPDDGVPLLVGQLPDPAPAQHPGVGHQDVQPAELLDAVGDDLPDRRVVANVGFAGQDLAALGFHQAHGLAEIFRGGRRVGQRVGDLRADIQRDDVGAFAGQPHRMRAPLRTSGAGNECHAPLQ